MNNSFFNPKELYDEFKQAKTLLTTEYITSKLSEGTKDFVPLWVLYHIQDFNQFINMETDYIEAFKTHNLAVIESDYKAQGKTEEEIGAKIDETLLPFKKRRFPNVMAALEVLNLKLAEAPPIPSQVKYTAGQLDGLWDEHLFFSVVPKREENNVRLASSGINAALYEAVKKESTELIQLFKTDWLKRLKIKLKAFSNLIERKERLERALIMINLRLNTENEKYVFFAKIVDATFEEISKLREADVTKKCYQYLNDWTLKLISKYEKEIQPVPLPETKPDKIRPVVNFEDIFNDVYKDIEPKIYEHYKNAKAIHLAYMLFAISDFGIIDKSVLNGNITHLHEALIGRGFPQIGTRQNLSHNIQNLHGASKKREGKLKSHKETIKALLKENLQNLQ